MQMCMHAHVTVLEEQMCLEGKLKVMYMQKDFYLFRCEEDILDQLQRGA